MQIYSNYYSIIYHCVPLFYYLEIQNKRSWWVSWVIKNHFWIMLWVIKIQKRTLDEGACGLLTKSAGLLFFSAGELLPSPQDLLSYFSQALTQLCWNASICLENEIYSGFEKIFHYHRTRVMTLIMPTALWMYLSQVQYRKAIYGIISILSYVQRTGFYFPDKVVQELFNNEYHEFSNGLW